MPSGQEQITPSPGATVQLWLQSPLSSEHRSVKKKKKREEREKIRGGLEENSCTALLFKTLET